MASTRTTGRKPYSQWSAPERAARRLARSGAALLLAGLLVSVLAACGSLNPATGRWQSVTVTPEQEEALGRDAHRRFTERYGLADEASLDGLREMLERVGGRLAAISERPDLDWRFYILDDDSVNAFAAPGGRVYVTRGLLTFADEEADVAGAIAHEIGHMTAAHYRDVMEEQRSALAQAKAQADAERAEAEAAGKPAPSPVERERRLQELALQSLEKLSQRNELEADRLSARYLAEAGYPPEAALAFMRDVIGYFAFLDRDAAAHGLAEPEAPFQTHPMSDERIAQSEAALQAAIEAARKTGPEPEAVSQDRDAFLTLLDGVRVESGAFGVLRGGRFGHPALGVRLDAPDGMRLVATRRALLGKTTAPEAPERTLYLDSGVGSIFPDLESAVEDLRLRLAASGLAETVFAADMKRFSLAGWRGVRLDVPPPSEETGAWLTLLAVEAPGGVLRLIHGDETESEWRRKRNLRDLMRGLRRIGKREAEAFQPLRLTVSPVEKGETIAGIARRTPVYGLRGPAVLTPVAAKPGETVDERALIEERLRRINGLDEGAEPAVGMMIKRLTRETQAVRESP